jgi:L,D-peptidoglycan transpeptidase YkuD (ErfK/YbiS/YcfS/YnhG family)
VITVTAPSTGSTRATVQAWTKSGSGWQRVGPAIDGYVGSQGMTTAPSESKSATPMGSFTLTQAFGSQARPATDLPYFRTTPADWWISQTTGAAASVYNTHQRCTKSGGCGFHAPSEQLYYAGKFYNYAVVIDYNTRNAPGGVRLGAGSAIFLHVHPPGTGPTAGCVAIPQDQLLRIMRWLEPSAHPRILIGTA